MNIFESLKNDTSCRNLEPSCGYGEPLNPSTCSYCRGICVRPNLDAMPKDTYDPEDGPYFEALIHEDFIRMQALCYAFVQAEDAISVIYKDADWNEAVHATQVKELAIIIAEYYDHFTPGEQRSIKRDCHWFDEYILDLAAGKVKER